MAAVIGDPRKAGEEGQAGDTREAGEEGQAGDPREAGEEQAKQSAPARHRDDSDSSDAPKRTRKRSES